VLVHHLELLDFRNYGNARFEFTSGVTAVVGDNGQGKTNLAEALAYLSRLESFRRVPPDALVRAGCDQAVLRAEVTHDDGRRLTVDTEINRSGRNRVIVNGQRLLRSRDLLGVVRVSVFSPDDLALVKGGPSERRDFLDETLVALHPKYDQLRRDVDRILKQRNTLLKQAGGRLTEEIEITLDVWDAKLADAGEALGRARAHLVGRLLPLVVGAYDDLAGVESLPELRYAPAWRDVGLQQALASSRVDDVRRQLSTVGPHRDELELFLGKLPVRTHRSQGEQRCLALALRLAAHRLVTETIGAPPVLVLDDVLSELDVSRSTALLRSLPRGQVVLTTAGALPPDAPADRVIRISGGAVASDGVTDVACRGSS
jgi:DNA replication and repair protein RecF